MMFWPIDLPFQITFGIFVVVVALITALAPALTWKRGKTFLIVSAISCLAFIPSCTAIGVVMDAKRFGVFQYDEYADVMDFRIERYLPTDARNITVDKYASGHRAKYSITKSELIAYPDDLWNRYGQRSAISREELNDGSAVSADSYQHEFDGLGWPVFEAVQFYSPVQGDGGGATYYFDPTTDTAYHRAGYW